MNNKNLLVADGISSLLSEWELDRIQDLLNTRLLLDGNVLVIHRENNKVNVIQGEKLVFSIDKIKDSLNLLLEQHTKIYLMVIEEVYYFSIILCV